MYNKAMKKVLVLLGIFSATVVFAAAESTNFKIIFDSINVGGILSTSTNYSLEDTMGEAGTGDVTSTNYLLDAGYQQYYPSILTITASASGVSLSALDGDEGGTSTNSVDVSVATNNSGGYSVYVQSSAAPALQCASSGCTGQSFQNYIPGGAAPTYAWSAATSTAFGYTVSSSEVSTFFKNDGGTCNTGSNNSSDNCWWYFTTSPRLIQSNSVSNILGTTTTLSFRAQAASSSVPTPGTYQAQIIVTAIAN